MGLPNRASKILVIYNPCSDNPPWAIHRGSMGYEGVRRLWTELEYWDYTIPDP